MTQNVVIHVLCCCLNMVLGLMKTCGSARVTVSLLFTNKGAKMYKLRHLTHCFHCKTKINISTTRQIPHSYTSTYRQCNIYIFECSNYCKTKNLRKHFNIVSENLLYKSMLKKIKQYSVNKLSVWLINFLNNFFLQ